MSSKTHVTVVLQGEGPDFLRHLIALVKASGETASPIAMTVFGPDKARKVIEGIIKMDLDVKTYIGAPGFDLKEIDLAPSAEERSMVDPAKLNKDGSWDNKTANPVQSGAVNLAGSIWATPREVKLDYNTRVPKSTPVRVASDPSPTKRAVAVPTTTVQTLPPTDGSANMVPVKQVTTPTCSQLSGRTGDLTPSTTSSVSPPASVKSEKSTSGPLTREQIFAAMMAASPFQVRRPLSSTTSTAGKPLSDSRHAVIEPSIAAAVPVVQATVNSSATFVLPSPKSAAVPIVNPAIKVSPSKIVQPRVAITASVAKTTFSEDAKHVVRPSTTTVVARRMIGQHLGGNFTVKEHTSSEENESGSKGNVTVEKDVKTAAVVAPEKEEVIMAVGLGGSCFADPEVRARTKPRPLEDFWAEQVEAQNRQARYINEHLSRGHLFDNKPEQKFVEFKKEYINGYKEVEKNEEKKVERVEKIAPRVASAAQMTRDQMFAAMRQAMAA